MIQAYNNIDTSRQKSRQDDIFSRLYPFSATCATCKIHQISKFLVTVSPSKVKTKKAWLKPKLLCIHSCLCQVFPLRRHLLGHVIPEGRLDAPTVSTICSRCHVWAFKLQHDYIVPLLQRCKYRIIVTSLKTAKNVSSTSLYSTDKAHSLKSGCYSMIWPLNRWGEEILFGQV